MVLEIRVPRETVNDDEVLLVGVHASDGALVRRGQCLFEIETSKAVIELDAPGDGLLRHDLCAGQRLPVGSLMARIGLDDAATAESAVSAVSSDRPALPPVASPGPSPEPVPDLAATARTARAAPAPPVRLVQPVQHVQPDRPESPPNGAAVAHGPANVRLSTAAALAARSLGIDPAALGPGLVRSADVVQRATRGAAGQGVRSGQALVIVGAGGHARMCIDLLRQRGEYELVGLLDPALRPGDRVLGLEVLGTDELLPRLRAQGVTFAVNGLGAVMNPAVRQRMHAQLKGLGFLLPNLVHPRAVVEPSVQFGEGCQVMMGACVGSAAVLGDGCVVNSGAVVSHDCVLEPHAHVAPGAVLAGSVTIGRGAVVGMAATVFVGVQVAEGSMLTNGVHLFRDTRPGEVVKSG